LIKVDNHGRKFGKFRAVIDLVEVCCISSSYHILLLPPHTTSQLLKRRDHPRVKASCLFGTATSLLRTVSSLYHFALLFQSEKSGNNIYQDGGFSSSSSSSSSTSSSSSFSQRPLIYLKKWSCSFLFYSFPKTQKGKEKKLERRIKKRVRPFS